MSEPNPNLIKSIDKIYNTLQSQFVLEQGPPGLGEAVTNSDNRLYPVHRWFGFKEAFSASIFDYFSIDETHLREKDGIFIDPFCGSGTTVLSGDLQHEWECRRIGIETNPFIAFVANTKANWRRYDPAILETLVSDILVRPLRKDIPSEEWPILSTLRDPEMFEKSRVSELLDAVRRGRMLPVPYSDIFLLGVAAIVEKLGLYRKTGRALRKLRGKKSLDARRNAQTGTEILRILASFADDLRQVAPFRDRHSGQFAIMRANGCNLDDLSNRGVGPNSVSLMIYSPPYLNQIDYTEVYKVESWILGFTDSNSAMKEQRLATVRSHSSIKFPESKPKLSQDSETALGLINALVSSSGDAWHRMFPRTANGYFSDMQQSMRRQFQLLRPGGQVRCVIGNSAHGTKGSRIAVATDLFIADIAKSIGFNVPKIQIGRMLPRKDHLNLYLRESVVWMNKPAN